MYMTESDEGYSRNALRALNTTSTILFTNEAIKLDSQPK